MVNSTPLHKVHNKYSTKEMSAKEKWLDVKSFFTGTAMYISKIAI